MGIDPSRDLTRSPRPVAVGRFALAPPGCGPAAGPCPGTGHGYVELRRRGGAWGSRGAGAGRERAGPAAGDRPQPASSGGNRSRA
ncbi:hypothetical protein FL583_01985 [Cryptosporangium phraense]|uniref:Uncharacterized protein n=1 Tax=Cryptosporangium phraense TaxID=2593070 RepID=A0A545B0D7_9ACTN|nr:hypothetical protein FL583_01985 [Cryptosporangium phraense]